VSVLAGGSGTRFWPASRERRPKQVLSLIGGRPLVRAAVDRARLAAREGAVGVVTRAEQEEAVRACLPDVDPRDLVVEPEGRDTAAAVALACAWALGREADPVVATLPADHVIEPDAVFASTLRAAGARAASSNAIVTLGVTPARAATGYGYVRTVGELARVEGHAVLQVAEFVEKPEAARAEAMVASGEYLWNAGIVVFRASVLRAALLRRLPDHARAIDPLAAAVRSGDRGALGRAHAALPRVSFDRAVLEKEKAIEVVPLSARWDDVGSWAALERHLPRDAAGNTASGPFVGLDAGGIIAVAGEGQVVAAIGVRDLVIVHTPDATLVCRKADVESVKRISEILRERGLTLHL
jgi:mannose-1-phosphate guanylyltransferase